MLFKRKKEAPTFDLDEVRKMRDGLNTYKLEQLLNDPQIANVMMVNQAYPPISDLYFSLDVEEKKAMLTRLYSFRA